MDNTKAVEMTEETHEGAHVFKVTYFEGGLDVAMFRFATLTAALHSIKQFYADDAPLVES